MQWLVNTSLLKVICRGIWLCKLTYPVIYRLTLNKSDLHQTNTILNIYKQWPPISAIRTTIYEMPWSLSSMLTLHRSVQLKLNSDVNWTIKLSQNQVRANTKQNSIRWCQQFSKPDTIGRIERDLTWNKFRQLKIQTKHMYKRSNANIPCQLLHQSGWQ